MAKNPPFDVTDHLVPLRRYARALTANGQDVEDLVQDAVLRAYEKGDSYLEDMNSRGWLFSILRNLFLDRRRAHRATALREGQAALLADQAEAPRQENLVRLSQIRAVFFRLPDDQRVALTLVAIEGLSCRQAAGRLGVPMGTLVSRLARARAALRAIENATEDR